MKKLLILFIIAFASFTAKSEETLFSGDIKLRWHLGIDAKFTNNMADDFSVLFGPKLGIFFYQQFVLGIGFWANITPKYYVQESLSLDNNFLMSFGYSGFYLGYIFNPEDFIHFTVNCIMGPGQAYVSIVYYNDFYSSYLEENGTESFGIIEPGIQLEFNLSSTIKIALGGSYRYLFEFDNFYDYEKTDFEGLSGVLTLKLGK